MAIYRNVNMSFWSDAKVIDDFTPEDKYFYLYLITNPQTNLAGCYEVSLKTISDQTGYNKDTVERLLTRFEEIHNVIRYCKSTKEIYLLNWSRYNWTNSSKLDKPLLSQINQVKSRVFKEQLLELYNLRDTVSIPYAYPMDTTVTVTVTDTVNNNSNNNKKLYIEIVNYLNSKTGSNYKNTTKKTQDCIKARLKEGFTVDDFKKVIDIKCAEWIGNAEMQKYIRPETLFGTKFESYLNQKGVPNNESGNGRNTKTYEDKCGEFGFLG